MMIGSKPIKLISVNSLITSDGFLDSVKLQYCRLRHHENQSLFLQKIQSTTIDCISTIKHLKQNHYKQALENYSIIVNHLR
jgi:hypothetical protein